MAHPTLRPDPLNPDFRHPAPEDGLRSTGDALDVVTDGDLPPTVEQPSLGDPVNAPGPLPDTEPKR